MHSVSQVQSDCKRDPFANRGRPGARPRASRRRGAAPERAGGTAAELLRRLQSGEGAEPGALPGADGPPVCAALFKGDVDLPADSLCYALFRERVIGGIAASDLIS